MHLDGYRGSRPVRIGNAAHDQFQLDVYGEVARRDRRGRRSAASARSRHAAAARRLADDRLKRWREPDAGIWEKRGGAAAARARQGHGLVSRSTARDAKLLGVTDDAARDEGRDPRAGARRAASTRSATRSSASSTATSVDASLLFIARVGFIDPADPRMLGTIDAIRADARPRRPALSLRHARSRRRPAARRRRVPGLQLLAGRSAGAGGPRDEARAAVRGRLAPRQRRRAVLGGDRRRRAASCSATSRRRSRTSG